ncbi:MAG TPA: hypothetical protein PKA00_16810 [Saprospiraceae bacterium]|nr:hypothetical protein [Saprospiraceae bacterium]HMQ84579.1 hypothetical protein [Saprospiraceae bacterium]
MKLKVQKIAQLTGHQAAIFDISAAKSPSASFFSVAGDGWIVKWDMDHPETGRLVAKTDTQLFSLHYFEHHNKLLAGNIDGGLHWIDLKTTPIAQKNIAHHRKGVFGICPVRESAITLGGEGWLTKWDVEQMQGQESLALSNQSLRCIAYAPDRNELAIGSSDHHIYMLDASTLQVKNKIEGAHESSVFSICYAPGGSVLLSGGRDARLKAWELDQPKNQCVMEQAAHWYTINAIAFHPAGHLFATASRDKTIKFWHYPSFELLKVIEPLRDGGHVNSVNRLFWSSYKNQLISCSDDRSLMIWDTTEVEE